MTVAVLYIDPKGPYPRMAAREWSEADLAAPLGSNPRIDCWDASRDARLYEGPYPVVAHPPCRHWSRMRHLAHVECRARKALLKCDWRGPLSDLLDDRCPICGAGIVSDADCAPRAVEQVRRWGGVLEHPAGSKLWEHYGLPELGLRPGSVHSLFGRCSRFSLDDSFGGFTIEVDQVEWGHVARKRTWLYLVGVPREALEAPPFPGREPTHWASGGGTGRGKVPPGIKVCSAQQRRRTPVAFAEYLIRLARASRRPA